MKKLTLTLITIIMMILFSRCDIDDIEEDAEKLIKVFIEEMTSYGNFCGPYNEGKYIDPIPSDDLDSCCQEHDDLWGLAEDDKDFILCGSGLRSEIDKTLVECAKDLDEDPSNWEIPPEDVDFALGYRDALIFLFSPCMAE